MNIINASVVSNVFVLLLASFALIACAGDSEGPQGVRLMIKESPDENVVAAVWVPNSGGGFGATISQSYQLWLRDAVEENGYQQMMVEADKTGGLVVTWMGGNLLEICYGDAQILHFRNKFVIAYRGGKLREVELVLKRVASLDLCK